MIALSVKEDVWGRNARPYGTIVSAPTPPKRQPAPALRPPYAPDAPHLTRFWIAGPLTLILFIPAFLAGIFGMPAMIPGLYFAWRMLRSGEDSYHDFAWHGFLVAVAAMLIAVPTGYGALYILGLVFGPLMAMTFRWIAGIWRPAPRKQATPPIASPSATMPDLARIPRTQ